MTLVGNCMGSLTALHYVAARPDQVRALVLFNTNTCAPRPQACTGYHDSSTPPSGRPLNGACHGGRDIAAAIQDAGFATHTLDRFRPTDTPFPCPPPHILGTAIK